MRLQTMFNTRLIDGVDGGPDFVRVIEDGECRHLWAEVNG
jgi:hypothetical protein